MDKRIVAIRASSFGSLFDCALRWEMTQLHKLYSPTSPRALIGTGVHAGTAAYDQARVDLAKFTLDDAVGAALDEIRERIDNEPVRWDSDEPSRKEVESLAMRMTLAYCNEISPRYEFDKVELTTKPMDIDMGDGLIIRLTGTLDRSRRIVIPTLDKPKRRMGDLKTGKAAVDKHGRANTKKFRAQLGTYELLYEHSTGEPIDDGSEVIGMNTTGPLAIGTAQAHGCKASLLGTETTPGLIKHAEQMIRTGLFPPNPQSSLCSPKYCPHYADCPYVDH